MTEEKSGESVRGSCLCGEIRYKIKPPFVNFQYCHCSRCRKVSGSAHCASIFVPVNQFEWLSGENFLSRYELAEAKYFATNFCKQCGSSMPWITQDNAIMIVTAGTLDEQPKIEPQRSIRWNDRASWYKETCDIEKIEGQPNKSK